MLGMQQKPVQATHREYRFHARRRWRFDAALPDLKIAVEYQGLFLKKEGQKGGHQTIKGLRRDWEKIREAQLAGWIILPFGPDETRSGEAMNVIARAIESRLEGKAA